MSVVDVDSTELIKASKLRTATALSDKAIKMYICTVGSYRHGETRSEMLKQEKIKSRLQRCARAAFRKSKDSF